MTSATPIAKLTQSEVNDELQSLIDVAGTDERRVLLFLCRRFIGLGQRDIGRLNLVTEHRDGLQEAAEEAADGLFYMSLRFLLAQINSPVPEPHDTEPGRMSQPMGPARFRNEAGQPIEDDDVPEEDWP